MGNNNHTAYGTLKSTLNVKPQTPGRKIQRGYLAVAPELVLTKPASDMACKEALSLPVSTKTESGI